MYHKFKSKELAVKFTVHTPLFLVHHRGKWELDWKTTLIMFVTMWAASQLHLALAALLGPIAYFLALWFLRIIGDEELQILRTILPAPIATRLRLV